MAGLAADKGTAQPFIEALPESVTTLNWGAGSKAVENYRVDSGKRLRFLVLLCASNADLLVLDEPTSAMDAEAEVRIFDHFRAMTQHANGNSDFPSFFNRADGRPDYGASKWRAWSSTVHTTS